MHRRKFLLTTSAGLGVAAHSQTLATETRLPAQRIQDHGYSLYSLEAEVAGKTFTLLLDTGNEQSWVDVHQVPIPTELPQTTKYLTYSDGSRVSGTLVDTSLNLGGWRKTCPFLLVDTLEGPTASVVSMVNRLQVQGLLCPSVLPELRRVSLSFGGKRAGLILNPSFYPASVTLPLASNPARVLLGQDPPIQTLLDSSCAFIFLRPSLAAKLGVTKEDLSAITLPLRPDVQLAAVTRILKFRLGNLYLRFDPPRVLVVEQAPPEVLATADLILGVPFFEQVSVTWDHSSGQIYIGENA